MKKKTRMSPIPPNADDEPNRSSKTLAELLVYLDTPALRRELEEFRIKYESKFGETDLTKRYTCTWPLEDQNWLVEHHPKRYWNGLPPFAQAYLKEKMRSVPRKGKLDDMPATLLRLYLTGQMEVDGGGYSR